MKYIIFLICLCSFSGQAIADECAYFNFTNVSNGTRNFKYKINISKISEARQMNPNFLLTEQEAINGVIAAADNWNNKTNSFHFQYIGTTDNVLPPCNQDYSLVIYNTNPWATIATSGPICTNNGNFGVAINMVDSYGSYRNFGDGSVNNNLYDITHVMTHEFGHVANLDHPTSSVHSIMNTGSVNDINFRWFYEYDLDCLDKKNPKRNLSLNRIIQNDLGEFASSSLIDVGSKIDAGLSFDGSYKWTYSYLKPKINLFSGNVIWKSGNNINEISSNVIEMPNGIGFVPGLWREFDYLDRIFYSDYKQVINNSNPVNKVVQCYSSNKFNISYSSLDLKYCNSMSGFEYCTPSSEKLLFSPDKLSFAYLSTIDRTVTSWINHERSNNGRSQSSNEIWISIGSKSDDVLTKPFKTGIKSIVAPSVACYDNFYAGFDCILAYVPMGNYLNLIRIKRFKIIENQDIYGNYGIELENGSQVGTLLSYFQNIQSTASPMALWYNSSTEKFYIVFRSMEPFQNMVVYSSSTGVGSWTILTSNLDYSVTGPSAVSSWRGSNNILTYTK